MKLLAIIALVFISAEAPDINGALIQLGAVAFIALVFCIKQITEVKQ